jgi:hypothetical protein
MKMANFWGVCNFTGWNEYGLRTVSNYKLGDD